MWFLTWWLYNVSLNRDIWRVERETDWPGHQDSTLKLRLFRENPSVWSQYSDGNKAARLRLASCSNAGTSRGERFMSAVGCGKETFPTTLHAGLRRPVLGNGTVMTLLTWKQSVAEEINQITQGDLRNWLSARGFALLAVSLVIRMNSSFKSQLFLFLGQILYLSSFRRSQSVALFCRFKWEIQVLAFSGYWWLLRIEFGVNVHNMGVTSLVTS